MPDVTDKHPQISEMFQKFALAFKTKTFEFFADDEPSDSDGFALLDLAEDFIPDQKVIIIKPDQPSVSLNSPLAETQRQLPLPTQMAETLISSIFATTSSFEASYLQLQTAHVPFNEESIKAADRALVSHLQRLSDFKQFYKDCLRNGGLGPDLPTGSCLEAQVQENQHKLRALGTVSDRLQAEMDQKDNEVLALRKQLSEIQKGNSKLSKKLSGNSKFPISEISLSIRVFDSVLHDASKATHRFTRVLISLMRKTGWDLDLAANSVYPGTNYAKKGHNHYAFLSYVCLGMCRGFDSEGFGLSEPEAMCNGHGSYSVKPNSSLKQLLEHISSNPMEILRRDTSCEFSRFCERKYQELIHPTMESSIFSNLDQNEAAILNSWRSLSSFYESFVNMASSIWTLHKLAFSFDPVVEIFQVERGVDFSMVYMEDVTRKQSIPGITRLKVGFTVIPGFTIGKTVIQCQVYLSSSNCTD